MNYRHYDITRMHANAWKKTHFKQKPRLLFIVDFHYVIMEEPSRHVKAMNNVRACPPPKGILNENIISF
jgi:hypothetical protein